MDMSTNNPLATSGYQSQAATTAAQNMFQLSNGNVQQPQVQMQMQMQLQRMPGEKVKSRWTRSFVTAVDSHNDRRDRFVCDICQKDLATPQTLDLHRSTHFIVRRYRCEICKVSFNTQGHLHKHRRSSAHESRVQAIEEAKGNSKLENPRPFGCPKCNVAFRKQGHLSKHLRSKSHFNRMETCGLIPSGTYAAFERSAPEVKDTLVTTDYQQALDSLRTIVCANLCMSLEGCAEPEDSGSNSPTDCCSAIAQQPETMTRQEKDRRLNTCIDDNHNRPQASLTAYLAKEQQQHPAAAAPLAVPLQQQLLQQHPSLAEQPAHQHVRLGPHQQPNQHQHHHQQQLSISMDPRHQQQQPHRLHQQQQPHRLHQHPTLEPLLLNGDGLHRPPDPMMDRLASAEQSSLDVVAVSAAEAASQVLLHRDSGGSSSSSCKAAFAPSRYEASLYLDAAPHQQQSSTTTAAQLNHHLMYATAAAASNANKIAAATHTAAHQHHPRHQRRPLPPPMSRSHVM